MFKATMKTSPKWKRNNKVQIGTLWTTEPPVSTFNLDKFGSAQLTSSLLIVNNIFQYRLHTLEKLFTIFYLKLTTTAKTILCRWTKNLWWQKKTSIRCSLCGSASTGLAFQILEASSLDTIPLHPLQLQPCCPNSRPQGVDDPFHDSRSLGSAISQSAFSKPIKYT